MKKLGLFLLGLIFLAGCSGITVTPDQTKEVLAKIAGRTFGYKFSEQNKDAVPAAIVICNTLITGDITTPLMGQVQAAVVGQIGGDKVLMADFSDLLTLLQITVPTQDTAQVVQYDSVLVKAAAKGVLEGIQLWQETKH